MTFDALLKQLGEETGGGLELSAAGTCAALCGDDEVDFEAVGGRYRKKGSGRSARPWDKGLLLFRLNAE